MCATIGTQQWIYSVSGSEDFSSLVVNGSDSEVTNSSNLWQPWYLSDNSGLFGGYSTRLSSSLAFVTVRSAGHEVLSLRSCEVAFVPVTVIYFYLLGTCLST